MSKTCQWCGVPARWVRRDARGVDTPLCYDPACRKLEELSDVDAHKIMRKVMSNANES